jgi:hypothetical protein
MSDLDRARKYYTYAMSFPEFLRSIEQDKNISEDRGKLYHLLEIEHDTKRCELINQLHQHTQQYEPCVGLKISSSSDLIKS